MCKSSGATSQRQHGLRAARSRLRCAASLGSPTRPSQQTLAQPTLLISAHRAFALGAALTESDIADNALATLSGSGQVAPTYWLDHKTGVSHLVNLQTPQTQLTSMSDLETIPIDKGDGDPNGQGAQILGGLSQITQVGRPLEVSHRDILPVIDIYASNQRTRSGRSERCGRARYCSG